MSRSYKHRKSTVVHVKDRNSKFGKQQASSKVRRAVDVPNGKQYKNFIVRGTSATMNGPKGNIPEKNFDINGLTLLIFIMTDEEKMSLNIIEISLTTGGKPTDPMSGIIKQSRRLVCGVT